MRTNSNLISHEIIGLNMSILSSKVSAFNGLTGRIAFETRNSILLSVGSQIKRVPKQSVTQIRLSGYGGACFINGQNLIGRPEDRITRSDWN